jgi:hypothetical protein
MYWVKLTAMYLGVALKNAWRKLRGLPPIAYAFLLLASVACGGSQREKWTEKDTEAMKDMSSAALLLEEFCARGVAADAGTCQAAAVRQVEVGEFCAASGRLLFHGQSVVGGGPSCSRPDGGK